MVRHSKNNTSGAFFTSAEKLKTAKSYGTQTERLGVDSMRKADECCLCLHTVKNPVLCCAGYDSAISGDKTEGKVCKIS